MFKSPSHTSYNLITPQFFDFDGDYTTRHTFKRKFGNHKIHKLSLQDIRCAYYMIVHLATRVEISIKKTI